MQPAILEEMEACNLISNASCRLLPVRRKKFLETLQYENSFFLYEEQVREKSRFGLLCSILIGNELKNRVYTHEKVYSQHVKSIYADLKKSFVQKNPILFLTDEMAFSSLISKFREQAQCEKEVSLSKEVTHRIWRVNDLLLSFDLKEGVCLVDGHHRYGAFLQFNRELVKDKNLSFLAAIFHAQDVKTKRKGLIIRSLPMRLESFLDKLRRFSKIKKIDEQGNNSVIKFFIKQSWYQLEFHKNILKEFSNEYLDIEIFKHIVLKKVLDIDEYRNNLKIELYPEAEASLEEDISQKSKIGFIFPPDIPMKVLNLAKQKRILEPNSTFFEPKFINNLINHIIYSL